MPFADGSDDDRRFMSLALDEARVGYEEGGVPVGSVLVEEGSLLAKGHNRRVQEGDPIAHGEMDCLRRAGRRPHYRNMTLYTTLSPCMMCTGTILQFAIPRVVVGERQNFEGNCDFLAERGVEVVLLNDPGCIDLMKHFIQEKPDLWNEDITE
ncbi:MAG: nucleoside deaminase [Geminicoccales bacterium]